MAERDPELPNRPVRIANMSGFYGDRNSAFAEQVRGGEIDVITGDYLAEVTMLILAKSRLRRPDAGYATTFLRQMEPVMAEVAERGIKVVVNAGGLNPKALAELTRSQVTGFGLTVAHVEGDEITDDLDNLMANGHELRNLDTGAALKDWGHEAVCANAYLGGHGITAALAKGADIVITGRVADASLITGAAAWWWGWDPDQFDELAGAVVAGHIIECGAQATGGNFANFRTIDNMVPPGFPIAEIDADGSSVITKHPDTGGAVTVDTITAQLVYEIGDAHYLNPDVITDLSSIQLSQEANDRVKVTGVKGLAPPRQTKVSIVAINGWRNATNYVLTGGDLEAKKDLIQQGVKHAIKDLEGIDDLRFIQIGTPATDPDKQFEGSCIYQVIVSGSEEAAGRAFSSSLTGLGLSSYPGLYSLGTPGSGSSRGVYWPGLIDQTAVEHRVVHHDGSIDSIAPISVQTDPLPQPAPATAPQLASELASAPTQKRALGEIALARSGDKGGNANVGLWVLSEDAYAWLCQELSVERFVELVPEAGSFKVSRTLLPNLRAINFVVSGILEEGAAGSLRFDAQAKALGEWIRARHVEIPEPLLASSTLPTYSS